MNISNLNIACTLTQKELQERRQQILQKAGQAIIEVKEI
jgi:hypothetical protein